MADFGGRSGGPTADVSKADKCLLCLEFIYSMIQTLQLHKAKLQWIKKKKNTPTKDLYMHIAV